MAVKRINLALQGGGAHGAFTWGALDRLLCEDGIEIAAISGTSAGALNGAAVKAGMLSGGREGARENLDWLWRQIGALDDAAVPGWMNAGGPPVSVVSKSIEYSPYFAVLDTASRMLSPYGWGPFYNNPLRRIVEQFNFDKVCAADGPGFFVSATNVRTGKIRVFRGREIGTDSILASACLPTLFQAVEIEDPESGLSEAYWDGGYTGNPALFPLYDKALPDDIVVININPLYRGRVPRTPQDIQNRINEISFNAALLQDLRAIRFVHRLIGEGAVQKGQMKDVLVHMIADDTLMTQLSVATKIVAAPYIIAQLKEAGQRAADSFLQEHKQDIGTRGSVDLAAMFS